MVLRLVAGFFVVLHGLVHLLYFAQSRRRFELHPGIVWPDRPWAFSRLAGVEATRWLAAMACILAAIGFVVGGGAILLEQAWWQPVVVGAAAFSTAIWVVFWDGKMQKLADQGAIAILLNLAILALVIVFE